MSTREQIINSLLISGVLRKAYIILEWRIFGRYASDRKSAKCRHLVGVGDFWKRRQK